MAHWYVTIFLAFSSISVALFAQSQKFICGSGDSAKINSRAVVIYSTRRLSCSAPLGLRRSNQALYFLYSAKHAYSMDSTKPKCGWRTILLLFKCSTHHKCARSKEIQRYSHHFQRKVLKLFGNLLHIHVRHVLALILMLVEWLFPSNHVSVYFSTAPRTQFHSFTLPFSAHSPHLKDSSVFYFYFI